MTAVADVRRRTPGDVAGGALIALTSLQFGAVVVFGKFATRAGLAVAPMLATRFAIAAALLAFALAAVRQPLLAAPGERLRLVALGVAGYAVEAGLFFAGLAHGTVPAVTLLFFMYPVFVSAIAFATGRGLPGRLLGAALLSAMAGAALVVLAGGRAAVDAAGVAFALSSALAFALYLVGADAVLKRTNSLAGAMWVSASAAAALAIYSLLAGVARWPSGWHEWWPILGMAVCTAGAFVCLFAGLRRLGAVRTSIVAATEPLAAAALAVVFLGERLRAGTVAGGALILGGAIVASLARARTTSDGRPTLADARAETAGP